MVAILFIAWLVLFGLLFYLGTENDLSFEAVRAGVATTIVGLLIGIPSWHNNWLIPSVIAVLVTGAGLVKAGIAIRHELAANRP